MSALTSAENRRPDDGGDDMKKKSNEPQPSLGRDDIEARLDALLDTDMSMLNGFAQMNASGNQQKQHQRTLAPA